MCTGDNRRLVLAEARAVVELAMAYVDWRVVDEAIGAYAAGSKPPVLPRALVPAIQQRVSDKGITLPAFDPGARR